MMNRIALSVSEARDAYLLGRRLQRSIARARRLHPWEDMRTELNALRDEVDELSCEIRDETSCERIRAEALDVAIVALRIEAGR